jgi:hypothetical protein
MLSKIKAYFKLSKWESIAMLVLCGFMLLLVGINYSLPFIFNKKTMQAPQTALPCNN